jgi:CRISPR-associated endonuclease Csn1
LKDEKNIESIIDPVIRKMLSDYIAGHNDKPFEENIAAFSKDTSIKRLRCKTFAQRPIEITPNKKHPVARYYNPEDYFCAVIWKMPPKKQDQKPTHQAQYIRRTEVDKTGKPVKIKPHPAAKEICVLFKDDYIEFLKDGEWKKARIAGYSATDNKLDIRPIFATDDVLNWIIATSCQALEKGWNPKKNHYYISVNKIFGEWQAHKITVSPIGEVRGGK